MKCLPHARHHARDKFIQANKDVTKSALGEYCVQINKEKNSIKSNFIYNFSPPAIKAGL